MLARFFVGVSFAALLAGPLSAQSLDMTPTSDRILSDPTYLPLKGEFLGDSSYGYSHNSASFSDSTGAGIANSTRHLSTLRQSFAYGVTDDLTISISEGYGFSGATQTTTAAGVSNNSLSGWADPTIGVTYRLLDQRNNPASLDLIGHYSPDAFSAHPAGAGEDGSIARGGPQADFGLGIGRQTKAFTIRGSVTATYNGRINESIPVTGTSNSVAAFWVPSIGIQTQTRLTPRLSFDLAGSYNFNGSPVAVNGLTGIQHTENLGDYETIKTGLNYHFIPNRLVGSLNYTHAFHQDASITFPSNAALDFSRANSENNFGVSLLYTFK